MVNATKKYRVDIYPPPLMVNATKKCRVDVAWPLEGWAFFKQGDKEIAPCRNGGLKATLFCRLDKATKQCQSDVLLSICHCWNYLDLSTLGYLQLVLLCCPPLLSAETFLLKVVSV